MVYGEGISPIKPNMYTRFSVACDLISFSLQGSGGGVASGATSKSSLSLGNKLMLAGLIFQIITLLGFALLCTDFAFRVSKINRRLIKLTRLFAPVPDSGGFLSPFSFRFLRFSLGVYIELSNWEVDGTTH